HSLSEFFTLSLHDALPISIRSLLYLLITCLNLPTYKTFPFSYKCHFLTPDVTHSNFTLISMFLFGTFFCFNGIVLFSLYLFLFSDRKSTRLNSSHVSISYA